MHKGLEVNITVVSSLIPGMIIEFFGSNGKIYGRKVYVNVGFHAPQSLSFILKALSCLVRYYPPLVFPQVYYLTGQVEQNMEKETHIKRNFIFSYLFRVRQSFVNLLLLFEEILFQLEGDVLINVGLGT